MKILEKLLFLFICACFAACNAEKSPTSLEKDKLSGPVKKITATQYALLLAEDGTVQKDIASQEMNAYTVYTYDENGNVSFTGLYSGDGGLIGSQAYEYDGRNNPVKITMFNSALNDTMMQKFSYDERNRVVEMSFFDKRGNLEAKELNEYEGDKQIVRYFMCRNNEEREISRYENILDENGNIIDNRWYADSIATSHYSAVFDSAGNRTSVFVYGAGDSVENSFALEYDDKGNITRQSGTDKDGEGLFVMTYEYEFDSYGNWTSSTEYNMADSSGIARPVSLIERKIEYYQ